MPTARKSASAVRRPRAASPGQRLADRRCVYIYDPLVVAPAKPREDAERLMRSFLPLAFRRPVTEELQQYYVKLVHAELDKKVPFSEAMIAGYKAALCSPHFLFLTERIEK